MMNKCFDVDVLFEVKDKLDPVYEDGVITIRDFYKNPEDIYEWLNNQSYPLWKYSSERTSRNNIDYNDCRLIHKLGNPTRKYYNDMERLLNVCRKYWHKGRYQYDEVLEFNCFQSKTINDTTLQHYPHLDSKLACKDKESVLNMLVYLDKEESGGTAIYAGDWITNNEHVNLLYPVKERFEKIKVIPAEFNTAVIFTGNKLHGAWIDDYKKYQNDKWRFSQVNFFKPVNK